MKIERELKRDKRWDLEEKNFDFEMDTSTINSENAWIQATVHSNNNNNNKWPEYSSSPPHLKGILMYHLEMKKMFYKREKEKRK